MITVFGATGLVGGQVCATLAARGAGVRAAVRGSSSPEKVAALRDAGVDVVQADLRDVASLDAACAGADAVISTVSSMPFAYDPGVNDIQTTDLDGMTSLVDAASRAGVGHFVYVSFSANLDLDFPLARAKRAVEQHLVDSGLAYTILHPSFFMDVWLSPAVGFDPGSGTVTIYGDGTQPISYIEAGDVAAFAVESLSVPRGRNAVLELGGPEAMSPLEVTAVFEAAGGTPLARQFVPVDALREQLAGATDDMTRSFVSLMLCSAQGDSVDMGPVADDFSVPLTSVREFAQR